MAGGGEARRRGSCVVDVKENQGCRELGRKKDKHILRKFSSNLVKDVSLR
jgi:hypothetical protein